jgi:DNA ligase (NAD+)
MQKRPATFATPPDRLLPLEAQLEHDDLMALIAAADEAYHGRDEPEISDADYDALRRRAEAIEAQFPLLKGRGLAGKVGSRAQDKFAKVRHRVPMLSLANSLQRQRMWLISWGASARFLGLACGGARGA